MTYSIRALSQRFQIPASTLRYYEEIGLLSHVGRNASGQRFYTEEHIERLHKIRCFKNTGMTLSQLQKFFYYEGNELEHIQELLEILGNQESLARQQLSDLQKDYAHLLRKLHYYQDIQRCFQQKKPLPEWKDYEHLDFLPQHRKKGG